MSSRASSKENRNPNRMPGSSSRTNGAIDVDEDSDVEMVEPSGQNKDQGEEWDPDQDIEERRGLRREYRGMIDEAEGEWQAKGRLRSQACAQPAEPT